MHKSLSLTGILILALINVASAAVLIDFSPDTTGGTFVGNFTNSIAFEQIIGDQFTLGADSVITGAAIYTNAAYGVVGLPVRVLIYSSPFSGPIYNFATTLDLVDSLGTTSNTDLARLHVSIPNLELAAGTYWFALPAEGIEAYAQATGTYSDSTAWINPIELDPPYSAISNGLAVGDTFFQIEGNPVPEPSTMALVLGLGALTLCFRRGTRR